MKKILFKFIFISIILLGCNNSNNKSMNISGSIKGLKKGTLYLQKLKDSSLINVDSFKVNGQKNYFLADNIIDSEMYYLYLNKEDGDTLNDRISFFGEKGNIKINTLLTTFESSAKIYGSENNLIWEEYNSMIRKFNSKNLEIIKEYINKKDIVPDKERLEIFENESNNLLKRRYLFSLNFASLHSNKTIAPYIALYEVPDANPRLLDTLYSNLSEEVKNSKYGKIFGLHLNKIK
ncbi:MAG: DUF4369 domain-containing protein [Flavobacteriaceae bacterium]|nr:DUF4369 domain-containing protein [Flavobacteriaceae bacterium]